MLVKGLAYVGNGKLPGGALYQSYPEPLLQLLHMATEAGLGHLQGPGGGGEAPVLHNMDEIEIIIQVNQGLVLLLIVLYIGQ